MRNILIMLIIPMIVFAGFNNNPTTISEVLMKTADYTMTVTDYFVGVNTTSAAVELTLPAISACQGNVITQFDIGHFAGVNNVLLTCGGTDTFAYGNTFFNLGTEVFRTAVAVYPDGVGKWGLVGNLRIRAEAHRDASWASTNFSSTTVVPWDDSPVNTQDELIHYQEASSGTITATADASGGKVTVTDAAHGLVEGDRVTISGTTSYNGDFKISGVTTDTFDIVDTWVADETGSWVSHTRVWVGTPGSYHVSYLIDIDSTGGSTWNATAQVYKNGASVESTRIESGNYGNEDQSMALPAVYIELDTDDYLDVRISQNNLTGDLTHCLFQIGLTL